MRIGLLAAILVLLTSASQPGFDAVERPLPFAGEEFFETLRVMIPARDTPAAADEFVVRDAAWQDDTREVVVSLATANEKGTLVTLMGLPSSTMFDAFQISANHGVNYVVPVAEGQAVPCQLIVRTAFDAEVIDIDNAPAACERRLQVSGRAAVDADKPMAGAWVRVSVDDIEFVTFADADGIFDLQVYSQSDAARLTITAEGLIDDLQSVIHVYSGSVGMLLDQGNLTAGTSAWAAEILGRRHKRPMHASTGYVELPAAH